MPTPPRQLRGGAGKFSNPVVALNARGTTPAPVDKLKCVGHSRQGLNLGFSAVARKHETHDQQEPVCVSHVLKRYSDASVPVFPEKN